MSSQGETVRRIPHKTHMDFELAARPRGGYPKLDLEWLQPRFKIIILSFK